MRLAVIGMGNVGTVLGGRWAEKGHEVTFCVRDRDDPKKRAKADKVKAARCPPVLSGRPSGRMPGAHLDWKDPFEAKPADQLAAEDDGPLHMMFLAGVGRGRIGR